MILFSLMIYDVYDSVARGSTSFANYQESLVIVDSNIHYGEKDTCSYITCIGHIKNNSSIPWEKIRFEIQYFNKDGELIDTVADKNYSVIVPPDTEVAFRVYDKAAREKEQYVKHNVIVRWADDAR